jgi:hypothetical protein
LQTDPYGERGFVGPGVLGDRALRLGCGQHGIPHPAEGDKEGIALCVDLDPAVRREHAAQKLAVLVKH